MTRLYSTLLIAAIGFSCTSWSIAAIGAAEAFSPAKGPISASGKPATIDVPANLHIKNLSGSDGLGLCVFTSVELSARWQNVTEFDGFQKWMTRRPGGGSPNKLDKMIALFAQEKGLPAPLYIQHTGGDETVLELALITGRMPSVTYAGRDDFYRPSPRNPSGRIAHMVNLAHLDATEAAIIDNNRPGVWVWMTRAEFLQRWRDMDGGWAVVLLAPPPPPPATSPQRMFGQTAGPSAGNYFWYGPYGEGDGRSWQLREVFCNSNGCSYRSIGLLDFTGWYPRGGECLPVRDCPKLPPAAYLAIKPLDPPAAADVAPPAIENYGIELDKVHQGKRYSISGFEVDRDSAMAAMTSLANDSGRYHLSIVSDDDAARRAALQAIAMEPALAAFRDKVHVQSYRSTDWPVQLRSLKSGLTVQKPRIAGGAVVWQSPDFTPAMIAEGLKYTDPNFSPPKPMPAPPSPAPSPPGPANPNTPSPATPPINGKVLLILIGVALLYFQLRNTRT